MCRILVTSHSCGHYRASYDLCRRITPEEIQWIRDGGNYMTIVNNCQVFKGNDSMRQSKSPCSEACVKAHANGWRCCNCTLRRPAGETECNYCCHQFCSKTCYALGKDDNARMTGPYGRGVTMPMDIVPMRRWGSRNDSLMAVTGFRWGMNYPSDRSS